MQNSRAWAAAGLSCAASGTSRGSEWRLPLRRCCRVNDPLPRTPPLAGVTDEAEPDRSDVRLLDDCCTPPVKEPLPRSGTLTPLPAPFPLPCPLSALPRLGPPPLKAAATPSARPVEMRLRRLGEAEVASRSLGDDSFRDACGMHAALGWSALLTYYQC